MSSKNSKRINIGEATYQAMMGTLKEHIDKITLLNLQNLSSQSCEDDRQTVLETLFSHELYRSRAMGTLNNSFKIVAREPKIDESSAYERMVTINSPSSVTLIGVPDEVNLYCKIHPQEQTINWSKDQILPNRDFLQAAYPWKNLHSIIRLIGLSKSIDDDNSKYQKYIQGMLANAFCCDFSKNDKNNYRNKRIVDVCFFDLITSKEKHLTSDHANVFRETVSYNELVEILCSKDYLLNAQTKYGFKYIAFKLLQAPSNKEAEKHSLSAITPIQSYKPKTYVIFADSFDLSVLKIPELKDRIPNLVRLYNRSTHFNRFISISGWTFPCLHSFHTGLPPYLTFSIFRHEPTLRLGTKINEYIAYQEKNARKRWNLIKQSFDFKDFPVKSDKFITRLIEVSGGTIIAVKGSYNHGWYNGLTHSTHLSIENTTSVKVGDNLRSLQNILCDADFSLCLIDLDHIHKKNDFVRSSNKNYFTRPLDLLKHVQTDEDSFRGEYITPEIRQHYFNLYLDNVIEIDEALGQIFSIMNDNDNIVMFSDHGSDLFQLDSPYQCDNNPLSSLLPQRVLKPTLLVSAPSLSKLSVGVCDELVSTIDLNSIILRLCGLSQMSFSPFSNLPTVLGGESRRTECYSFSQTNWKGIPQEQSQFELMRIDHNLCCDSRYVSFDADLSAESARELLSKLNASNINL